MKTILLAALLSLLCVGWAEAFEVHVECKDGKQGEISCTKATVEKDSCLAKMEAAMKAMDEYLRPPHRKYTGDETNWFEYRQINPGDKRRHDEGMLVWEAAKHTCWKSGR